MQLKIEVKRRRLSVTQGMADVFINGKLAISFGDEIVYIKEGERYYGDLIGNYASKKPDVNFIKGLLWHPYDDIYHYSDKAKEIIEEESDSGKICTYRKDSGSL